MGAYNTHDCFFCIRPFFSIVYDQPSTFFSILQYFGKYKKTPVIQHMQLPLYKSFIYLNSQTLSISANNTHVSIPCLCMKIKRRDKVNHMARSQITEYAAYIKWLDMQSNKVYVCSNYASFDGATCKLILLNIIVRDTNTCP